MPSAADRPTRQDIATDFKMHVDTFGLDPVVMVVGGYYTIVSAFEGAKKRGLIPRGASLVEMIDSSRWHIPELLTVSQFEAFQRDSELHDVNDVVHAIRFMLTSICDEQRLTPGVFVDLRTEALYVQLRA